MTNSNLRILFLFLDGVGLGANDPGVNPLAAARMPVLEGLLDGQRLLAEAVPLDSQRASLRALDACLGVEDLPQSASGQATLFTGRNIPAEIGYHYGPKPNPEIMEIVRETNLFSELKKAGRESAFINAYPEGYFEGIRSGRRLYAAIPLAAYSAGVPLRTTTDLYQGKALSADFTALGWREHLGQPDAPVLTPYQAGQRMVALSQDYDFTLFEYWLSDYSGHRRDMETACALLETFDQVLDGLLADWDDQGGLIMLTSDHGNMEDLGTRRHTTNPVPLLLVGAPALRASFADGQRDLADITPAILRTLT